MTRHAATCLLVLSAGAEPALAQDDVVVLLNGDRITGEIEALERGRLRIDTDAMGVVNVKWELIANIESTESFEIQDEVGTLLIGPLVPTDVPEQLVVGQPEEDVSLDHTQVAVMHPIGQDFWARLDGSLDAGVSFTQANTQFDYTFNGNVTHSSPGREVRLEARSLFRNRESGSDTNRQHLTADYLRELGSRWLYAVTGSGQRNDELSLRFRGVVGGGAGRYLRQSARLQLAMYGGLVYTEENFSSRASNVSSLESVFSTDLGFFAFRENETEVTVGFSAYPSLTRSGRVRMELDSRVRREVIRDLFFSINLFNSFDSKPPQAETKRNDFGVTTSFGWSF